MNFFRRRRGVTTAQFIKELKILEPGKMLKLISTKGDRNFIILDADDFEHIAGLAGLQVKDLGKISEWID